MQIRRLHLYCYFNRLFSRNLGRLGVIHRGDRESDANQLGLLEPTGGFEFHARIQLAHGLRLMTHPEVVNVLLAPLTTQPSLSKTTEGMKTHALFVELHCLQARGQPSLFQVMVHVGSASSGVKKQALLPVHERLQESRDIGRKFDLAGSSIGFRILNDSGMPSVNLLANPDRAATVYEVLRLQSKSLRDSQTGRRKQNIQCLLLTLGLPHKFVDGVEPKSGTTLIFRTDHREIHHRAIPLTMMNWLAGTTVSE